MATRHPRTLALEPTRRSRDTSRHVEYATNGDLGISGTTNPDPRLPGKSRVLGLTHGVVRAAVALGLLEERGLMQVDLGGLPVVIVPVGGRDGRAFVRRHAGGNLNFETAARGRLIDSETGSLWDAAGGQAIGGELTGVVLERLNTRTLYWFVWASFYPETRVLD